MLKNLFPSTQNIRLSRDSNEWPVAIEMQFRQKYPEAEGMVEGIEIKEISSEDGTAVGFIKLINNIKVSFVVKDYMLSPLDVAYINDDAYQYITPETISGILSNVHPFRQIPQKEWKMINNASFGKFASQIYDVDKKEVDEVLEKFAEFLPNGDSALKEFQQQPSVVEFRLSKKANAEPVQIYVDLKHVGNTSIDDVSSFFDISPIELCKQASIEQLINTGSFRILKKNTRTVTKNPNSNTQFDNPTYAAKQFGEFYTLDKGWRTSILYKKGAPPAQDGRNLLNDPSENKFIAIASDGDYAMDPSYFRHATVSSQMIPTLAIPKGHFGIVFSDTVYLFSLKDKVSPDGYAVIDENYQEWMIKLAHGVKRPYFDIKLKVALFPKKINIYPIRTKIKSITPMHKFAGLPIVVTHNGMGYNINDSSVSGLSPEKLASLGKSDATSALMAAGISEEESKIALGDAMENGSTTLNMQEKTASATVTKIRAAAEKFIKSAASEDNRSVDDILALHLVTDRSLPKFKGMVPRIIQISSDLTRLLLASRLNEKKLPIDEDKLTQALDALNDIKMELSRL